MLLVESESGAPASIAAAAAYGFALLPVGAVSLQQELHPIGWR